MTTTTERHRGHIADLMCALRPDWDIAGCITSLRKLDLPLAAVIIAATRYAEDQTNLTPTHLADLTNRAWDTDWYPRCPHHPEQTRRHTSGECATCRADRIADETGPPPRQPTPPPRPLRQLVEQQRQPDQPAERSHPRNNQESR